MTRPVSAWAAVGKKSGKVLRDLDGQYSAYTRYDKAAQQCGKWGEVRAVSIRVLPRARDVRGVLKRVA